MVVCKAILSEFCLGLVVCKTIISESCLSQKPILLSCGSHLTTTNLKHFEGRSSTAKLGLSGARPILDFKRLTLKAAQSKELGCKSQDSLSSATVSGRGHVPIPPFLMLHKHLNTFPDPTPQKTATCAHMSIHHTHTHRHAHTKRDGGDTRKGEYNYSHSKNV